MEPARDGRDDAEAESSGRPNALPQWSPPVTSGTTRSEIGAQSIAR